MYDRRYGSGTSIERGKEMKISKKRAEGTKNFIRGYGAGQRAQMVIDGNGDVSTTRKVARAAITVAATVYAAKKAKDALYAWLGRR